jgi:hypothetical protein
MAWPNVLLLLTLLAGQTPPVHAGPVPEAGGRVFIFDIK